MHSILASGDEFSVYLMDTHDGNANGYSDISAGTIIPYEEELINWHHGYNKNTGTNIRTSAINGQRIFMEINGD